MSKFLPDHLMLKFGPRQGLILVKIELQINKTSWSRAPPLVRFTSISTSYTSKQVVVHPSELRLSPKHIRK